MTRNCGWMDTVGRRAGLVAALAAGLLATGCGGDWGKSNAPEPRGADDVNWRNRGDSVADLLTGGKGGEVAGLRYGSGKGEGFVGEVNKHLWRASLDTLSFLPLAATDPYSGVIATDWQVSPDDPNERLKVAAYVTSRELDARALKVAVFREVQTPRGWVTAAAAPDTARKLEDAILTRARQLRLEEVGG